MSESPTAALAAAGAGGGRFPCPNPGCCRSFQKKPDLTQHQKDCGQIFPCITAGCGSTFKNKVSLHRHQNECGLSFMCPLAGCGKEYKTRAGLQQHVKLCGYPNCPCGYRLNVIGEYVKHQKKCQVITFSIFEFDGWLRGGGEGKSHEVFFLM